MKFIIASDIHGCAPACRKLLDSFAASGADRLILLGDLLYHGPRNDLPEGYDPKAVITMLSEYADRLFCVRGNCDTEVDQMVLPFPIMAETALLFVDGREWFACHGHRSGANPSTRDIPRLREGSVILSGHTHVPVLEENADGILLFNPGSVSIPKENSPHSYMLMDEEHIIWKSLDGEEYHRL